ncbi:inactive polyglycylase TTLL10 isoform X2 [Gallus gallus]|uniref:inactive polyglycylase TTLL10 isoform X2 n=1 Tax=Gallus gallus TaxID=9031 RepID=UPI001F008BD1|nr:inactive polyglycylase TTLL10 isoform X2 [Gallus gallus]
MGVRSNPAKSPRPQYLPLPPLLPPMFSLLSSVPQQSNSKGSPDAHCGRRAKTRPALGLTLPGGLISMRAQLWGAAEPHLHPCWAMELQDTGKVSAAQQRGHGGWSRCPGSAMASVPPKRKRNSRATRQGHHQQQARSLSADRGKPRENLSPTSEAELDRARPCESRMCGKAHPQGKHPEELIREVPMASGPYFYISGSNGAGLVSIYCQSRGWQRIYDNRRQDYALKWCEIKCRETYYHFKEGEQLLYQIPNNSILTSKTGLLSCLREQERVMKKINRSSNPKLLKMEEFFPESFRLDLKEERNAFFEHCKEEEIWICKPSCSNQGRGIFLLKNPSAVTTLQAKLYSSERDLPSKRVPCGAPQTRIVQRYIDQPLLLEGKKFDVRSYLLIACTAPYVLFFAQGYVRLTCSNYDATSDDLTVHLTNQYMQKKNSLYSQLKDETVWGMEHFNSYINEKFGKTNSLPQDWVFTVFTRMKQIMLQCFLAAKHKLDRKLGYFDLIGCDFLIDENFKVWLLEMNANPALHTNCKVLRDIIPSIIYESLDLVLEIFTKCLKGQSVLPLKTLCHFVLLYNEDAADLGQKQPWKLSTRLCTGRYLRPHTDSTGHIRYSPAKAAGLPPRSSAVPEERVPCCLQRAVGKLS